MTPDGLKAIRSRLGLTQAEMAKELGVTRNTVARWEMAARLTGARRIPEPAARLAKRILKERKAKRRKR